MKKPVLSEKHRLFWGKEMTCMEKQRQWSDSFLVSALLALAGGFLDVYTYICRGKVFANAQTGNIVLVAAKAAEGEWRASMHYLVPVVAFAVGIWVAEVIHDRALASSRFHWRQAVLLIEIAVLVAAACIPVGDWNSVVNVMVSFVCALQLEAFRKVEGLPFASTMCTGNLRSGTESLYRGVKRRENGQLKKSGSYFGIIAWFMLGAAVGGVLSRAAGQWAVLAAAAFQLAALLLMCRREWSN